MNYLMRFVEGCQYWLIAHLLSVMRVKRTQEPGGHSSEFCLLGRNQPKEGTEAMV